MLTSNVQLGYILTRGLGQAVQGGLSCPLPRSSERMDNQQFLLHHLLQKYLVITDINFISVNLRCSLQCRTPEREVRGSRPTAAVLCPWARHFTPWKYWLITQEAMAPSRHDWKIVDWDVKPQHNQPTKAHFKVSVGLRIDKGGGGGGGGQAVQGGLSPNFITPSATGIFSWKGYKHYFNQSEILTSKVQLGYVLTGSGGQAV